ncbi:MAG: phosphate acyltransferase PlsX [Proteobacteria bacterium]|nr:phosphate acyltransferase PlsX [Pseudomonadota bacterium]
MKTTLAIDVMGGDLAPASAFEGINLFLQRFKSSSHSKEHEVFFSLFGIKEEILPYYLKYPDIHNFSEIQDCALYIRNEEKLTDIIRHAPQTSLGKAILSVMEKKANAVVSSGNTGAFMALCKIYLKTFEGIDRPAIPAFFPTLKGQSLMLDLGANVECSANMLLQFALMGRIYAQSLLAKTNPTVGILNIGSEATKGNPVRHEAARLLTEHPLINYVGFVEGTDISKGTVDIIVTDGFSGNIALKSIEGTASFARHLLREAFSDSVLSKLAYLLMKPSLKKLQHQLDQRHYNGAAFLGIKEIAVKSHGNSDGFAFSHALDVAFQMVISKTILKLENDLKQKD